MKKNIGNSKKKVKEAVKKPAVKKKNVTALKKLQYEFVSATSHQLRTPIASIQSSLDVLELYLKKENIARQLQTIHKIKKSIAGLNNTLERITTLYKNEFVKQKLNIAKIEPHKFFNDILDEVVVSEESCLIIVNIEPQIKNIYADELVLKQIMINLLSNAVKFSPVGGQIRLSAWQDKKSINISVKDEGIGINKNDTKKMYQPFYRGANASILPGDGLGLAIVKKLCDLHKFHLTCISELNKGTEFILIIPQKNNA